MRAVVIYEPMFGNTEVVAKAVAEGLRNRFAVTVAELDHAPPALVGVDLLVVGGPCPGSNDIAACERLDELLDGSGDLAAAAFGTVPRTSLAADAAPLRPEAQSHQMFVKPEYFYVTDTGGALEHGELERARAWGVGLSDAYLRAINHHEASRSGT